MVLVCSFALLSTLSSRLFYTTTTASPLEFLRLFSSGYGGLVSKLEVFAGLLVFFGAHALIRGAWWAKRGKLTPLRAYQSAVGAMILVWLPYYVNRMNVLNLWFEAVLLILLFAPSLPNYPSDALRARDRFKVFYVATAFALLAALARCVGRNPVQRRVQLRSDRPREVHRLAKPDPGPMSPGCRGRRGVASDPAQPRPYRAQGRLPGALAPVERRQAPRVQ